MNALIFINLNTALNRAIHFIRFRQRLSLMICQELAMPDTAWSDKHKPKVRVQSGFIPDDYKQPNQNRQSDVRQYNRPDTSLMVQSVCEPSLRYEFNRWNQWVYRKARRIVIPNHIKIQMDMDDVKIKIS